MPILHRLYRSAGEKFIKQVREEFDRSGSGRYTEEKVREVAELRVHDEIKRGVQTIQYQVITLMTTVTDRRRL